ncbi:MAG: YigZ family protein [bacterium]|nr:YigZ family protein [bacterium]
MTIESYRTLKEKSVSEGFYKEKGSKFLGFAFHVKSEEDVKDRIAELKKSYYDARHHCYAYVLGIKKRNSRANDDGEPGHSAGDPILGQIKSMDLTNTLVVVVRYFGGTKLGVSGLITAYKTAAFEALNVAEIEEIEITEDLVLQFPYESTNEVMRLLKDYNVNIRNQVFEADCKVFGDIAESGIEVLSAKVELLNNLGTVVNLVWPNLED